MAMLASHTLRFQRLIKRVQRPWARYVERRALERHRALAGQLLAQLAHTGPAELQGGVPTITSALITRSDVVVLLLAANGPAQPSVLKLPLTADAEQSLQLHRQVLAKLHALPDLHSFCTLLPRPLAWGAFEGQSYYLETALDGVPASDLVRYHAEPASLKHDAVKAIQQLHLGSLQHQQVDTRGFQQLVGDDLAVLYQWSEGWAEPAQLRDRLQSIEALLCRQLVGQALPFAWSHGDYWPGNMLVRPGGGLTGIIDWDRALPQQLPLLDILHLFAYTRKMQQRSELGDTIIGYLLPAMFDRTERDLIDQTLRLYQLPTDGQFWQAAVLWYWLRFAAANLSRYPRLRDDRFWLSKNVFQVLKRGMQ